MLRGEFPSAGELEPEALRAAYDEVLSATVQETGVEATADRTGIEAKRLERLAQGDHPDLTVEEAAAILATDPDRPDADSLEAEARDILLMGMTTAVMDVEALASEVGGELEPKEIQAKVEGRFPMSVDEYALLHGAIERRTR
jgi:hypothetical protein